MKLSIIIPAYNETDTIGVVLSQVAEVLPAVEKEIVIIDDCSTDGTRQWLRENLGDRSGSYRALAIDDQGNLALQPARRPGKGTISFNVLFHDVNKGKGAALQSGLAACTGDVIVIQDADLEYDPSDWGEMYDLVAERSVADVVYGSRFYGRPHRSLYFHHYMANRLISFLFNVMYNQTLTDIEVCYKMFTREVLESLSLSANDFGIEVQISSQIARARRWRIYEVGIRYYGRTYHEGKKINWKDGVKALWYLLKYRFAV
jgi:glycosyltransferase involved in cell wall biosynthesis